VQTLDELGIDTQGKHGEKVRMLCPRCSHLRKKKQDHCFEINTLTGCFHCFNCPFEGKAFIDGAFAPSRRVPAVYRKPTLPAGESSNAEMLTWFLNRGIQPWVLDDFRIRAVSHYLSGLQAEVPCIAFPYYRGAEIVNVKYRGLATKSWAQEKDCEKILYSVSLGSATDELIICEGEVDVLSFHVAGLNAASVPDGAPTEGSTGSDLKYAYLRNCEKELAPLKKIIIATDNDGPGRGLGAELARRLGEERCWRVEWPASCKDANDVLVAYGVAALESLIESARPWPIEGIIEPMDVIDEVLALRKNPKKIGVSTGWKTLDPFFKILMPEVTIIGGSPNHGKSNFINGLAMNMAKLHGYPVFMACFEEGKPEDHFARITAKYEGKAYWTPTGRVEPERIQTDSQVIDALQFMQGKFFLGRFKFEARTLVQVLAIAAQTVKRYGVRCVFVDPWNHLNHTRPPGMTETEEVSQAMSQLRDFAEQYEAHVFLCAHPAKPILGRNDGEVVQQVPHPYNISGSAHFFNKSDNCLTIFRDVSKGEYEDKRVGVYIQKIRTHRVGQLGMVELGFDQDTEYLTDLGNLERGTR